MIINGLSKASILEMIDNLICSEEISINDLIDFIVEYDGNIEIITNENKEKLMLFSYKF